MKYLVVFILLQFLGFYNSVSQAQWVQTTGPYKGIVTCFALSGTNIFAGTYGGVYLSTNNGTSWTQTNYGLPTMNSDLLALAISGTYIFAGTFYGVFLSTNNGTIWTAVNNGLPNYSQIYALAVNGTNLFAGTGGGGVYLSTNNGTSWMAVNNGLTNSGILALAVSGTNLFAGTYGAGVWKRPLSEFTGVSNQVNNLPQEFTLSQNYPNPWNPTTTINYSIAREGNVKLSVYNAIGSKVATIVNEYKPAGNYSIQFNGSNLASGIYLYRLESGNYSAVKKFILMK
jgi:Secretion system C-terminal sorting domain